MSEATLSIIQNALSFGFGLLCGITTGWALRSLYGEGDTANIMKVVVGGVVVTAWTFAVASDILTQDFEVPWFLNAAFGVILGALYNVDFTKMLRK